MKLIHSLAILAVVLASVSANPQYKTPKVVTPKPTPAELTTPKPTRRGGYPMRTPEPTEAALDTTLQPTEESTPKIEVPPTPTPERPIETLPPVDTMPPMVETEAPKTKAPEKKTPAPPTLPPVDFDCRQKDDGYYANPKDKCSSTYYACVGGLAREMRCAGSDLVYEPSSGNCERRQDSFRCSGVLKTTLPSTTRRPAPTPPKLPIDCSKLDDGWYPDPLNKCSHVFYSCSNGIGSKFDCPGNMYFNKETKQCASYQDVFDCSGKRPTTAKPTTTTKPPVTEKLPIDCSIKASGEYPDPSSKCSNIYYVCSNGYGFKRMCPGGSFFDPKNKRCDYRDEIFDCTGKTKAPTPKPTLAPKPSPASLPSREFDCKGKQDAGYTPLDKKCSEKFYKCVGGNAFKFMCPEGLYYDIEHDWCDRWSNLFVCSGKKPTTAAPTTTTEPRPTEKLPIDCSKLDDGDYPDPEKKCSNTYYSCSNQAGIRRLCPGGLYFDRELKICDMHVNVLDCSGKARPPSTLPPPTTKAPPATTKYPFNCEDKADGNYSADKCTDYYWTCVAGTTIWADCPGGTVYDVELDQCGFRNEIPSCGGVRPTTEKP